MPFYYKGYDINNKNRRVRMLMEYQNPYGYNFDYSSKYEITEDKVYQKTNQDDLKERRNNLKKC